MNRDGVVNVTDVRLLIEQALCARSERSQSGWLVNSVDLQIDINAALNLGVSAKQ